MSYCPGPFRRFPSFMYFKEIDSDQTVTLMEILWVHSEPDYWDGEALYEIYAPDRSAITFLSYGVLFTDIGGTTSMIPSAHLGHLTINEHRLSDIYPPEVK